MSSIKLILLVAVLIYSVRIISGKRLHSFAGPYRAIMLKIDNQTDEYKPTGKLWVRVYASQAKPKQLQYFWGHSSMSIPFDDNLKIQLRIAKRSNNQWKLNAFVMNFDNACSSTVFHAKTIFDYFFEEAKGKCPVNKVTPQFQNRTVDISFPQFPVFPYGHWRATLAFLGGNETVGVMVAEVKTVPKL